MATRRQNPFNQPRNTSFLYKKNKQGSRNIALAAVVSGTILICLLVAALLSSFSSISPPEPPNQVLGQIVSPERRAEFRQKFSEGREALRAKQYELAEQRLSDALAIVPNDYAAKFMLTAAQHRLSFEPIPYEVRFDVLKLSEGAIPPNWPASDSVGARVQDGEYFLQSSAEDTGWVSTPRISFPADFELEVACRAYYAPLVVSLVPVDGMEEVEFFAIKHGNSLDGCVFGFGDYSNRQGVGERFSSGGPVRIRLVKNGANYHLFAGDKKISHREATADRVFLGLRFLLKGGERTTKLLSFKVSDHPKDLPRPSTDDFEQTFAEIRTGYVPDDWLVPPTVTVLRDGDTPYLSSSGKGPYTIRIPSLCFSERFEFQMEALMPSHTGIDIELEGSGDSASVLTWIGTYGHVKVGLTGATEKKVENASLVDRVFSRNPPVVRFGLVRDGDIFRVVVDGETMIARRLPEYDLFRGLSVTVFDTENWSNGRIRISRIALKAPD